MKWISSIVASMVILAALSLSALACDDPWCDSANAVVGPVSVVPGETIHMAGPSGTYTYSWMEYFPGKTPYSVDGGSGSSDDITVPSDATTGYDLGAVLTVTENHGTGNPSCISKTCIWLQAVAPVNPSLSNFCIGGATTTDGFAVTGLPTGVTYKWTIDGTEQSSITLAFLNGLSSGSHNAILKLYRGTAVTKTYSSITFNVYAKPPTGITYQ
jgi:hypothetical protein